MPPPGALRVVERELTIYRRLWHSAVFTQFLSPILFLGAMGLGLGGLVDERNSDVAGLSYLVFVAPGIMAAGAMQSASTDSLWQVVGGMKWIRYFHGMVATPLRPFDVFVGRLVWASIRITCSATIFLAIAALLGGVPSLWGLVAIPSSVLLGLAFAAPLAAFSGTQENADIFPVILRLGIIPLFLFSGVFFPLEQLPDGLEPVAYVTPLWHGVELTRGATTGTLVAAEVLLHVAVLSAFVLVGTWFGTRTFTRRLSP